MFLAAAVSLMVLAIAVPYVVFRSGKREARVLRFKRTLAVNVASFFGVLTFATVLMFTTNVFGATDAQVSEAIAQNGMAFIASALAVGLGSIGAGIAVGSSASAALGALSENESIMGKSIIFVGLAEGVAIYGFVISFMILSRAVAI